MGEDAGSTNDLERMLDDLFPYRRTTETYRRVPDHGASREEILTEIATMAKAEDATGDAGRVSGSLYSGDHQHYHFLAQVFEHFAHANVLQRDMYPSATKFEGEIIAMAADLFRDPQPIGVVTSGGSDSLVHALYAYREDARERRGVRIPNVVLPVTAHVALRKGAHWMGIEVKDAPLTDAFVVDVDAVAGGFADEQLALFEVVVVGEDRVGFLGVAHVFLDAEVRNPGIEMQRAAHGDGREVRRAMAASADLVHAGKVGQSAQMGQATRSDHSRTDIVDQLVLDQVLGVPHGVEDLTHR